MTSKTSPFTIYPAIDLRAGHVVRLKLGDPNQQTVFDQEPQRAAERWAAAGAHWLHIVNLDGAFAEGGAANWQALPRLATVGPRLQFGGGIRSLDDVERALQAGAERVILGTVAVEKPELVEAAVARWGAERIVVALDARDGQVRTRGWQEGSGLSVEQLGRRVRQQGVTTVLHTDIGRDGVLSGVNARASAALAQATGLSVIASGGVASLDDIRRVLQVAEQGVSGVITGRALYEGKLDLAQALALVEQETEKQAGGSKE
jgi:phosphoribosylformimino-5-aminoimidazole carboxamide ribotide isomerase